MKITIIGAGGKIGSRIAKEAADRNHDLKLITSKAKDFFDIEKATLQKVDIFDTETLADSIENSDVVISAYAPPFTDNSQLTPATQSLLAAVKKADVRLIAVGGAGSLHVTDEMLLVDAPVFPEEFKPVALAHKSVLEEFYYKEKEANWTNVSPSAYIFEGERTNVFRVGANNLLANDKGESSISMEDFAVGILNEVEDAKYIQKRFTIGY